MLLTPQLAISSDYR